MPPMKTSSTSSTSGVDAAEQPRAGHALKSAWGVVGAAVDGHQTSVVFGVGTGFTGRDGLGLRG